MNISLPKIKLGKDYTESNVFDLSHDNNTTSEFGFTQPVFCQELMPRSVLKLRIGQFVRLGAMVSPTFGRVSCNTYHRFVPYHELLPSFEYLLAGKPYYTNSGNYIPSTLPYTTLRDLTLWLLCTDNTYSIYKYDNTDARYHLVTGTGDITTIVDSFNSTYYFGGNSSVRGLLNVVNCNENFVPADYAAEFYKPIAPDGSDFLVKLVRTSGSSTFTYVFCFRFSRDIRRIRKILIGCGYQLTLEDTKRVSIMPLLAYYKAWFDLFCPKQTKTWTGTAAFKFLDRVRETNLQNLAPLYVTNSDWTNFLLDLSTCFYTQKPDFVSANIATPAISSTGINDGTVNKPDSLEMWKAVSVNVDSQPTVGSVNTQNYLTRNRLLLLNKLTKFVNKNTVIGGKIADYLHVHYGADFGDDLNSYDIGQQRVDCKITEQMSTAATDKALLGEYAGKGIGADNGRQFTYRSNVFGCWVSLMAVVPNAGYCQAIDANNIGHLTRFDFPTPELDALGFEITTKDQVCAASDVFLDTSNPNGAESASFGFVPRYTHCKVKHNIANGCISLRSTRTTYLPYMLDRWITTNQMDAIPHEESDGSTSYTLLSSTANIPIASEEWRYPTKADYLGNFNRVFYNTGNDFLPQVDIHRPIDDNFIVHNLIDCTHIMPLLPISESYDTDATDDNTLEVTKA